MKPSLSLQDHAWLVTVPKRVEFSEPLFHFGERVKFRHGHGGNRSWETGRIIGLKFDELEQWVYSIQLDGDSPVIAFGVQQVVAKQSELQLVKDSCYIRDRLQAQQEWFLTKEAASKLGISGEQLRKLRLSGMFKSGYHYRDTSIPGSGRPHWQWHVERCSKALEIPAEKRKTQKRITEI
jgi:hypothetical protein